MEASVGVARIFQIALESGDDALWNAALKTLLTVDRDGRLTHMILQYWAQADAAGSASQAAQVSPAALSEHLVIDLLGKLIELETTVDGPEAATAAADGEQASGEEAPAACVAACRWCGAQGRWPLLALLVDDLSVPDRQRPASLRRGVTIDRLIAESLMQTRRGSEALAWWTSLCQVWQCDDFPTRLRAAEVAVAFGTPEDAQQRLQAAAAVADDDPFQQTLLQMLAAELQMRHRRWDQAQTALMSIADQAATAGPLRARAQWLIGECYLMQQKYTEAIDAYRRVERLDREGQWSAAAMLQAGQAHEKLGQAQQAAACYTDLLTRFANLPHADHARTRLAQLDAASSLHR